MHLGRFLFYLAGSTACTLLLTLAGLAFSGGDWGAGLADLASGAILAGSVPLLALELARGGLAARQAYAEERAEARLAAQAGVRVEPRARSRRSGLSGE